MRETVFRRYVQWVTSTRPVPEPDRLSGMELEDAIARALDEWNSSSRPRLSYDDARRLATVAFSPVTDAELWWAEYTRRAPNQTPAAARGNAEFRDWMGICRCVRAGVPFGALAAYGRCGQSLFGIQVTYRLGVPVDHVSMVADWLDSETLATPRSGFITATLGLTDPVALRQVYDAGAKVTEGLAEYDLYVKRMRAGDPTDTVGSLLAWARVQPSLTGRERAWLVEQGTAGSFGIVFARAWTDPALDAAAANLLWSEMGVPEIARPLLARALAESPSACLPAASRAFYALLS